MIEIANISKKYGKNIALNNVSFSIRKNSIMGLLGQNGAGKTSLMDIICGSSLADSGNITINGVSLAKNPIEYKKLLGYVPEKPPLYLDMTIMEYMLFVAELKHILKADMAAHINEILELTGLSDVGKRLIKNLSKGYKQRLSIAQALVGNPEILVLDEPTVGLDPKQLTEILALIKGLSDKHSILISSHRLYEIQELCSSYAILHKGELKALGNMDLVNENNNVLTIEILIEVDDRDIIKCLKDLSFVKNIKVVENLLISQKDILALYLDCQDIDLPEREFNQLFSSYSKSIYGLRRCRTSLEEKFLSITQ